MNDISREGKRYWGKTKEYSKKLTTHSKNKNFRGLHRGINEFKRGYQRRINL
jgi:hypothetical protein